MTTITVVSAGTLTLLQDLGRAHLASSGVARAGYADRSAGELVQRLVGNPPDAPALETLMGGLTLATDGDCVVAVTGAEVDITMDGQAQARCRAMVLRAGAQLAIATPKRGLRTYTALRGGLEVARVLDSRSRDTLGAIGPPPLRDGDTLTVGAQAPGPEAWFEAVAIPRIPDQVELEIAPGPHDDALDAAGWQRLTTTAWRIAPDSDRIGTRLDGPALDAPTGDLPSFPVMPGAVQLPPAGTPIVLGPDAGVTGGYSVIGVVGQPGLDALAQARPGTPVRFRRV